MSETNRVSSKRSTEEYYLNGQPGPLGIELFMNRKLVMFTKVGRVMDFLKVMLVCI